MENNFDILGIHEGASQNEIRNAFRKLALQHHSDRGGSEVQFKKIKQAYEDLKIGKKYPDSDEERQRKSKVYYRDSDDEIRRNRILAEELTKDMKAAEEWAAALNRIRATGTRLFGSKTLGEIEFERKANGVLSIKGNYKAGTLNYDGPIMVQGNITSPSWNEKFRTIIHITNGDFKLVNPLENKYRIENGTKIFTENGDIVVGNVFGRKDKIPDPTGKVGVYQIKEHRTELIAPRGKIIVENAVNTVSLESDSLVVLNLEDDIKINTREILIYGNKVTYDVEIELKENAIMRFFEDFSVQGFSDDAKIRLQNGKEFRLQNLKTKKIRDLPDEFVKNKEKFGKDDTLVGKGFEITYEILDNFDKKSSPSKRSWSSRLGFGR